MKNRDTKFLIILVVLMILNIVEALATAFWIDNNLASEANPLMETWLNFSHTFFITMKIFLVTACSYLLWILRHRKLTYFLIAPVLVIYLWVFLKHANIALNVFL